jgi:hypothetical protein
MANDTAASTAEWVERLLVWSVFGALGAGAGALLLALAAAVSGRWEASAIALVAAALAFGIVAKALIAR